MAEEKFELSVKRYFPKVKDFERNERGDPIFDSLRGPEKIEARQQLARERLVAAGEARILHDQLRWCYHKEGVNHYENCKEIAEKLAAKLKAPYYGMKGAPSTEW